MATSINPAYEAAQDLWRTCRDAVAGERAVHLGRERYLPKLSEQTEPEYLAYVTRTPFYGATALTIDAFVGMVFRKPPIKKMPDAFNELAADMTLSKDNVESIDRIAEISLREIMTVSRVGWLVEYPQTDGVQRTEAQVQALNLRPYVTMYTSEAIVDWASDRVNNTAQLVMVKLLETVVERDAMWKRTETQQERWLLLEDGRYLQRIYREDKQFGDDIVPMMNGAPLTYIPFIGICKGGMGLDDCKPPVMALVDTNMSHYRTCADLEHGAHFTGLPTPMIFGSRMPEGTKLGIGSTQFIVLPDQGTAQYLEFTGQGLGVLERLRDAKQEQMAAQGARMLAKDKKAAESAETTQMRSSGETAILATMANVISEAMQRLQQIMADWMRISGEISIQLNTDYFEANATAQEITAWVAAWQAGAMSPESLFWNLKQGELVPQETTYEEEQTRIQNQPPMGGVPATPSAAE